MTTMHVDEIKALAHQAHSDAAVCDALFEALWGDNRDDAVHSAWALTHLPKSDNDVIAARREALVGLAVSTPDTSLRRLTLALLERLEWTAPDDETDDEADSESRAYTGVCPYVQLLNFSMEHLLMPEEPYGVRALCMKLAYTLSLPYPELLAELRQSLLLIEPSELGSGVRHTRNKILGKLQG